MDDDELTAAVAGGDDAGLRELFAAERDVMNVEISDLTRRFGRTRAADGVLAAARPARAVRS